MLAEDGPALFAAKNEGTTLEGGRRLLDPSEGSREDREGPEELERVTKASIAYLEEEIVLFRSIRRKQAQS